MNHRPLPARILALLLMFLMINPLLNGAQPAPQLPNPGRTGLNRDQQQQLGLQTSAKVYEQMPVLPDSSPVSRYVQQLGAKLTTVIPAENSWPYQFHVVQQKEINAFALPGGPIFVNIGTIEAADNEAELAGVMAHEMSHVYMQHGAKQASKAAIANIFLGIAGAVLPGGTGGDLARLGMQVGANGIFLGYSRKDEAQADAVGAIIMYKAHYNPQALGDFFVKLEKEGGTRSPQFLSDHPNPGNREIAIAKQIKGWPAQRYNANTDQFIHARQEATKIKAYSSQEIADGAKQGLWARQNQAGGTSPASQPAGEPGGSHENVSLDQVKPSAHFKQLQQNGLSISYPDNWNPGEGFGGLYIAPPAGVSQSSLSYGVVIADAQTGSGMSLDQATEALIGALVQSNPGMKTTDSITTIQVGTAQGRSVHLLGESSVQQNGKPLPERDWLVTVPNSQGGLTYLIFVAPDRDFNHFHPAFQKMLESFRPK